MLKGDVRMNSECNKRACISGGGQEKGERGRHIKYQFINETRFEAEISTN